MISDKVKSSIETMTRDELEDEYKKAANFVSYGYGSTELKYAYAEYRDLLQQRLQEYSESKK